MTPAWWVMVIDGLVVRDAFITEDPRDVLQARNSAALVGLPCVIYRLT